MNGDSAQLPPLPDQPKETVDVIDMLVNHPKGAAGLVKILNGFSEANQSQYQQAALAMAMSAKPSGYAAFHHGALKTSSKIAELVYKLSKGDPR